MVDEDLRRLEREAAAGDPAACVRHAHFLERGGRRGEAARVLHAVNESAAAREVLATYPAWTHADGDAGGTRWLDVEPVTAAPRVLWKTKLRSLPDRQAVGTRLVASQLGLAVWTETGLQVHDVRDGRVLWRWGWPEPETTRTRWRPHMEIHAGQLLVANDRHVWRRGLAGGEDLGAVEVPPAKKHLLSKGVLYACRAQRLVAYPVAPGGEEPLWSTLAAEARLRAAGDVVVAQTGLDTRCIDIVTGRTRWRTQALSVDTLVDRRGCVSQDVTTRDVEWHQAAAGFILVVRGADGREVRRVAGHYSPRALAPEVVVAVMERPQARIVTIGRRSGDTGALPFTRSAASFGIAIARDVIHGARGDASPLLAASRLDGTLLWEVDVGELLSVKNVERWTIAVLDRVIVLLLGDGTLAALTDLSSD